MYVCTIIKKVTQLPLECEDCYVEDFLEVFDEIYECQGQYCRSNIKYDVRKVEYDLEKPNTLTVADFLK